MKDLKQLSKTILLTLVLSTATFTTVNADVVTHIETEDLNALVTSQAITPDGKYFYSITESPTSIRVHSRSAETGELVDQIQDIRAENFINFPDPTFFPDGMIISPDGKQVYISAAAGSDDDSFPFRDSLFRFDIGANGQLTYVNRLIGVNAGTDNLAITNNGRFIYAGDGRGISIVRRAPNGSIFFVEEVKTDNNGNDLAFPEELTVSPDDNNLYASSTNSLGYLNVFNINPVDGKLTGVQTLINNEDRTLLGEISVPGAGGRGTTISKDGKFLYAMGEAEPPIIAIFNRDTNGTLTYLKSVSDPTDDRVLFADSNIDLILNSNQKYMYSYDWITENLGVWGRNTTTGDLEFLGRQHFSTGTNNDPKLILSLDGQNLYINTKDGIEVLDLRANMSIVKTDSADPVNTSSTINYTLAVTNNGPSDAYNTVITDTLPAGTSFISGSVNSPTGSCSASGQTVTCTMGRMLTEDAFNAVIKVTAPSSEGQITNTATVTADQLDTNQANNIDTETTNIGSGISTPTTPSTPTDDGDSSGGGSIPFEFVLLMLIPIFLRRKFMKNNKA